MGREFLDVFEGWASTYDHTVGGNDVEYREVFRWYPSILKEVSRRSYGHVLEFGTGTGNLTDFLLKAGHEVTAIEPSKAMREVANKKLMGKISIIDGDFLAFPESLSIDTIASTYAFHHLTDIEKETAIGKYQKILKADGKIVFADTMFETKEEHDQAIKEAKLKGYKNLAEDLQTEYYTTIPYLRKILEKHHFSVRFTRFNSFVWILEAVRKNEG